MIIGEVLAQNPVELQNLTESLYSNIMWFCAGIKTLQIFKIVFTLRNSPFNKIHVYVDALLLFRERGVSFSNTKFYQYPPVSHL